MESSGDIGGDLAPILDEKCSTGETTVGDTKIDPTTDDSELTSAEKLMLELLLEKDRQGGRKPMQVTMWSQVAPNATRDPNPIGSSGRRQQHSKEDQSVLHAIDQLNELSDDQLTRMLFKFENEEEVEDGDGKTGDFLAWWMTQSQLYDHRWKTVNPVTEKSSTKMQPEIPPPSLDGSAGTNRRRREPTVSSGPKPVAVPGQPGRFLFSFMQDNTISAQPMPSISISMGDMSDSNENFTNDATFEEPMFDEFPEEFPQNIKMTRSERMRFERQKRRDNDEDEQCEEEEPSEVESEFSDEQAEFRIDIRRKPKPKKKRQLVGVLWDPTKPRPMPRRLRKMNVPWFTADQNGGSSSTENAKTEET